MSIDFPLSKSLIALNVFLPGISYLGWVITRKLFADRLTARVTSAGVSLSLWLLGTHLVGLISHSLTIGLVAASAVLGGAGFSLWFKDHRLQKPPSDRILRLSWEMFVFAAALTLPVALVAWRWSFHDEIAAGGHQPMIANIQNGYYPPRSLAFPQFALAYHYGFDLLCAMLTALFRISVTHAIDVATAMLWFYSVLAAWLLGERTVGRGAGPLVALVLLLGGGFPWTCSESIPQGVPLAFHLLAYCELGEALLNPNLVSYFFQHPWGLGIPIALTILLIEGEEKFPDERLRLGTLVVSFAALYLAQVVLFSSLLAAICASQLLTERTRSLGARATAAGTLAVCGVADVLLLGGFFDGGGANAGALKLHWGVVAAPHNTWWMLKSFGLPLLGLLGFLWLPRKRLLYASLAVGGILIINLVRYELTWDILKFATVASIGLAVPWAAAIHRLRATRHRVTQSWLPACLLVGTLGSSAAFLLVLALNFPGVPYLYSNPQPGMTDDAREAAVFLRRTMPHDAVMFRRYDDYLAYAVYAGLPQVWLNPGLGIDHRFGPERAKLCETMPDAPEPYLRQKVRYFVLDAQDGRLNVVADAWLQSGAAVLRGRFGPLRVVELLERPKA